MTLVGRLWLLLAIVLLLSLAAALGTQTDAARQALDDALGLAGLLLAVGLCAAAVVAWWLGHWTRTLHALADQAEALLAHRAVLLGEGSIPEFRPLIRSMNALARRLKDGVDEQAAEIGELRARAHDDPLTRLATRRVFVAALDAALRGAGPRGAGVLLVRVRDLQSMNQRIGRDAADGVLAGVAQVLQSYPAQVRGALAGRLNGSDFGLYLPAAGLGAETAASLVEALRTALPMIEPQADLRIGGVDLPRGGDAAAALAAADEALARAEGLGRFAFEVADDASGAIGERIWHARIAQALDAGAAVLHASPVRDASGGLRHLECALALRLEPGGAFEPAARWAPMAARCGLGAEADLLALDLVLAAVRDDGVPRATGFAPQSLSTPGFALEVLRRLQAAPAVTPRIWIEFTESTVVSQASRMREACALWRPTGVRFGLTQAGVALRALPRLQSFGLDHVKVASALLHGVAGAASTRDLARALAEMLHDMGLQACAQDIDDAADLAALRAIGFDAAGGAAVEPR